MSESRDRRPSTRRDERFPASFRVRKQAEFDAVYAGNRYLADDTLVITAHKTGNSTTRLGLSISRQVGNAVVRNRWKRLIREAFRKNRQRLPGGFDFVIRPRRGAVPQFARIERSIVGLSQRLAQSERRPANRRPGKPAGKKPDPPGAPPP